MEDILKKLFNSSKYVLVYDDFNVDMLEKTTIRSRLTNLFNSFNLKQ